VIVLARSVDDRDTDLTDTLDALEELRHVIVLARSVDDRDGHSTSSFAPSVEQ